MIGLVRFVGLINSAVWLGSAFYMAVGAGSAARSTDMKGLLGPTHHAYFAGSIYGIFVEHYYYVHLVCALVALLHLAAEWLYCGKSPGRMWPTILICLFFLGLAEMAWLQPKLRHYHLVSHAANVKPEQKVEAGRLAARYRTISRGAGLLVIAALAGYVWRIANPVEPTRFLGPVQFRG